jgi:hypothetical protein
MTTLDILIAARQLIDTPEKWAQGDEALLQGRTCAGLAINRTGGYALPQTADAYQAVKRAARCTGVNGLVRFNDTHSHAEVLAAFDKAIAAERAAPPSQPETEN